MTKLTPQQLASRDLFKDPDYVVRSPNIRAFMAEATGRRVISYNDLVNHYAEKMKINQ